jgi:uncharacterized protein DUF6088
MKPRATKPQSIDRKVFARIIGKGRGYVFTPSDFLDLGSRSAVDTALTRGARAGKIRKIARGLYDYPRQDPDLGLLMPSTEEIVRALRGRDKIRLQPSGAHAANVLGLSEQVPVRLVFLTDGRARTVRVGRRQIVFKPTTPRQMATAGRASGTVIQALRWLGKQNVDSRTISRLRRRLSPREKQELLKDLRYAPAWIASHMREIARPAEA